MPSLAVVGVAMGVDPNMSTTHIVASTLILIAGVLLPGPWERVARAALHGFTSAYERYRAEQQFHRAPTPTPALVELEKAATRAKRISLQLPIIPPPTERK